MNPISFAVLKIKGEPFHHPALCKKPPAPLYTGYLYQELDS